ncbi:hypothetical protein QZH41_016844, partial [Actinostola sp. cb2023]
DGNENSASFVVKAFEKRIILDTKNNHDLIPGSFLVRQFQSDGCEVISREAPEPCQYQGSIRGNQDSTVVLDTCNGLTGIIDDGKETYHIEPNHDYQETGAHKIYSTKDETQFDSHENCGTLTEEHSLDSTPKESKITQTIKRLRRSTVVNMEEVYRPFLTTNETRYNEVLFVVDNGVYKRYNSNSTTVINKVAILCNAVDAVYQRINVRIVMAAIEIWTNGDRMVRQAEGGPELSTFSKYRKAELIGKIPHDNAQFLSHHGWGVVAGMAWLGTMCGSQSAAVNAWSFGIIGPLVVVAHEMGHNFGYNHNTAEGSKAFEDLAEVATKLEGIYGSEWVIKSVANLTRKAAPEDEKEEDGDGDGGEESDGDDDYDQKLFTCECKCLTRKGCFMGGHKTRVPGFSDCNLNSMKRINDRCLYNVPTKALNARCGNGIREGVEECDCGTPEMCKTKDPCCIPHNCRLKPSAMCSDLHHSCCTSCQLKKQGTLCRAVQTDCDVPEFCTGESRDCPGDAVMQDGTPCNRTKKDSFSRIEARYVRINPQYWNGWICMRTELYGCSSNEANPTDATPLKPYNDYCIVPKNETCTPYDKSRIVFKSGNECNQKYMDFRLDANGILWHHCSKRRVCPENENKSNGVRLVISIACKDEDSKFVRTAKNSLKHVKSGKCVHPNGGRPGNNLELLLWSGCDSTRQEIWFMKPDCIIPFGIRSKIIPDSSMTASSSRRGDLPHYARLHNSKYWCAAEKKKSEYLQIDLGKIQTINKIAIQGRGSWYYWVSGFFLWYSQDGQRWTGYTESGDRLHSNVRITFVPVYLFKGLSYCYIGKCAETHGTQCRDLWGPDTKNAVRGCYDKLNTVAKGYGTCDPAANSSCTAGNVLCGQIQCLSNRNKPAVNYGKSYTKITLGDSSQCSAAVLQSTDSLGSGMVKDGTKCGDKKMCSNYRCKFFSQLNIKACPRVKGIQCNGRGVCTNTGVCQCYEGYDSKTACVKETHSCRHLQVVTKADHKDLPDGVYDIYPHGLSNAPIKAYCDMSRDGGGWTLLVTSHTNRWTKDNVILRNAESPSLTRDYSILKYADGIKNNLNVIGSKFEYRLEAQNRDRWGGIWEADRSYTFTATTNGQTNVKLVKKFDNWNYADNGIEKRMPWVSGARFTTSRDAYSSWYGTITGNDKKYHPAPWIVGHLMEIQPEYIWYWMREGPWQLPRSCMDIQMRGFRTTPLNDGVYIIQPPGKKQVKTYCDLTSRGGGWTLLVTSKTHTGWTADNVKTRNTDKPSLDSDYSILDVADAIKDFDTSQDFFQYRIEADGQNQYGGIFDASREYTFTSTCDKQTKVQLIENFNNISKSTNLVSRMPRLGMSSDIFLRTGSTSNDASGSIVYNDRSSDSPSYLPSLKPKPGVIRYWMREGTRRSCFDIKVHGVRLSRAYKDNYYMIRLLNDSSYLPVFCDMTSDPGAFTLVVTSRHNKWTRAQVPARNVYRPALNADYSILKYADVIKKLGHNSTFKYKLDAHKRGHWGGVWSAPRKYSFMATSTGQTQVTLLKKFNNWNWSWWKSVQNRMPWFDAHGKLNKALLTTSSRTTNSPSGSIIWGDTEYRPAYWMLYGGMSHPGVIWYWVNEDDCDTDRKPVHGGLSEWSDWEKCDKLCANGKQRRHKTCSNPKPRCGGKLCNPASKTIEEKACYSCPESPIRSYGGYCIQPKSGDCNPIKDTNTWSHALIFKRADANCSANYMNFLFDSDGIIIHKCSGKIVCPQGKYPTRNKKLLLMDKCPRYVSMYRRLPSKSLQNKKTNYCVHPNGGWPRENGYLVYWKSCNQDRLNLDFFKLRK